MRNEQRIVAAKVIRRWIVSHMAKTAFVIEHDFVMASALADRVIVCVTAGTYLFTYFLLGRSAKAFLFLRTTRRSFAY
jgi:ABC-type branched-subunit amino acid transport system ATPase component